MATTSAGTSRTGTNPVRVTQPVRRRSRPRRSATSWSTTAPTSAAASSTDAAPARAAVRTSSIAAVTAATCHASAASTAQNRPSASTSTSHQSGIGRATASRARTRPSAGQQLGEAPGGGERRRDRRRRGAPRRRGRRAAPPTAWPHRAGATAIVAAQVPSSEDVIRAMTCDGRRRGPTTCPAERSTTAMVSTSSIDRPRRRRTGSSPTRPRTSSDVQRPPATRITSASTAATGFSVPRERSVTASGDRQAAAAEHGLGERLEPIEVGTQHQHVARLQGGVGGEEVTEGVAQHLELAGDAVARVDLDARRRPGRGRRAWAGGRR